LDGNVGTVISGASGAPDIKPERVKEFEVGVDANLWNGRATLEVTGYSRHTYDLLLLARPRRPREYTQRIINGGVFWNKGIEIGCRLSPRFSGRT